MANEILIIVKAKNEATGVFEALKRDAAKAGDDAGETITKRITEKIQVVKDDPALPNAGALLGDRIGHGISEHIRDKIKVSVHESIDRDVSGKLREDLGKALGGKDTNHERIKVDVDVDKKSFLQRLKDAVFGGGESIGKEIGDDVRTGFSSVFSGDVVSMLIKGAGWTSLGISLGGIIGPAVTTAVLASLGGGAIALGVAGALKDPLIAGAIKTLKDQVGNAFGEFGTYFKAPIFSFLQQLPGVMGPLRPILDDIGSTLQPIAIELGQGIIGFLQNVLPAVGRAIKASAPVLQVLADKLPGLGDSFARLLDHISNGAPEAANFFSLLLDGLNLGIRALGVFIELLNGIYAAAKPAFIDFLDIATNAFTGFLRAANWAFGWIPGLGPKLQKAGSKVTEFREKVIRELNGIPNRKDITVFIHAIGTGLAAGVSSVSDISRALGVKASGGITGSANGATPSGLTWVGEHGPELINVPAGTRVWSNPDSMRMARGSADGSSLIVVPLVVDGQTLATAVIDPMRRIVRQGFGGSAQAALGVG